MVPRPEPDVRRKQWPGAPTPKRRVLHHVPFVHVGDKCNALFSVHAINPQTSSQKELQSVPVMTSQCHWNAGSPPLPMAVGEHQPTFPPQAVSPLVHLALLGQGTSQCIKPLCQFLDI